MLRRGIDSSAGSLPLQRFDRGTKISVLKIIEEYNKNVSDFGAIGNYYR